MATRAPAVIKLVQPTAEKVIADQLDQSTAGHMLKSNFSHHKYPLQPPRSGEIQFQIHTAERTRFPRFGAERGSGEHISLTQRGCLRSERNSN